MRWLMTATALAVFGSSSACAQSAAPTVIPPRDVDLVSVVTQTWHRRAGVTRVDIAIRNANSFAVKDPRIECALSGRSGTVIQTVREVAYEILRPGLTTVKGLTIGFVDPQVDAGQCRVMTVSRP